MDREEKQREILQDLIEYSESLIPAVQEIIEELRNDKMDDTEEFLGEVITGINWEIEVYNQCAGLISGLSNYIDKKTMISAVKNLGSVLQSGDRDQIADCFETDFLPFLNKLTLASKVVVNSQTIEM